MRTALAGALLSPPMAFDGYAVAVTALEPYPYSNVRIAASRYVATVVVTRP